MTIPSKLGVVISKQCNKDQDWKRGYLGKIQERPFQWTFTGGETHGSKDLQLTRGKAITAFPAYFHLSNAQICLMASFIARLFSWLERERTHVVPEHAVTGTRM